MDGRNSKPYLRPGPSLPGDLGLTGRKGAGPQLVRPRAGRAPVGRFVGVDPAVCVDPVAGEAARLDPVAAAVAALKPDKACSCSQSGS